MMDSNDFYEKALISLKNIEKWLAVTSIPHVKNVLETTLQTDEAKKIYELSDGSSQVEIANKVGVSQPTVGNYWKKWAKLGLVEPSVSYKGRWQKLFSLEDFIN